MIVRDTRVLEGEREVSRSHDTERTSGANYRELVSIAGGGSATISIALAQGIGGFSKLVVLKTIREEFLAEEGASKMFMDEARLSARLNHPNVVHVYEVFLRRHVPIIVMEFLDGQPLSALLSQARATIDVDVGIAILIEVLAGLHYVHTLRDFSGEPLSLVHRDVSPHNVMVTYDGQVKLVDFGIAKFANSDRTRTGTIKGKLTYMAPEQFIGNVDRRADIFSVGVMLWEVATRQRYWGGVPEPALVRRLLSGDLPHLQVGRDMDPALLAICHRALAIDVEERYPTALAMQEDLERYHRERGVRVSPADIGRVVTETCAEARQRVEAAIREQMAELGLSLTDSPALPIEPVARPDSEPAPEPRAARSRQPLWLGLAAAVVVVGGVILGMRAGEKSAQKAVTSDISASRVAERPTAPSAPAALEASVNVRASAEPLNAVWYLDGRRLESNPLRISLPKDAERHMLRAEAPGYESYAKVLRLDADVDITTVLVPKRSEAPRRPAVERASVPNPPRATAHHAAALAPVPVESTKTTPAPAPSPDPTVEFGERIERRRSAVAHEPRKIDDAYPGGG